MENSFDLHAKFGYGDVPLVCFEIRERTISCLQCLYGDKDMKGPKKPGKHDYIVFTAIDENHRPFRFVVEKIRRWTLCSGMDSHIHMVPLSGYPSVPSRSRFLWELRNPWIVSTTEFNTILTTSGHHYNSLSANCWSCATDTVQAALDLRLRHSQCMQDLEAERGCLEALQRLETVKRPLPLDVIRLVCKPLSRKNPETWRRITNSFKRRFNKLGHPAPGIVTQMYTEI